MTLFSNLDKNYISLKKFKVQQNKIFVEHILPYYVTLSACASRFAAEILIVILIGFGSVKQSIFNCVLNEF
jgi:hypothetical protein